MSGRFGPSEIGSLARGGALACAAGLVLTGLAALGAGPATGATAPAAASTVVGAKDALSGVGAADRTEWARWRGQPVSVNEAWNDPRDGNGQVTWAGMNALWSTRANFSDGRWSGALSLGQPMYASNETVNSCASVAEITTFMQNLKDAWPRADAFIRLGLEFNGNWFPWSQKPGDAAAFKACWIRWHGVVKAASPNFKLVWNPNNQSADGSLDVRDFWPGKQYVDAAGPDAYALGNGTMPISPDKLGPHGEPLGVRAWAKWVAAQGVPLAAPEWGIREQPYGAVSPSFLDETRQVFEEAAASPTGLAYESYFDGGKDYSCQFSIHDTSCPGAHPAASARYQQLWSAPYAKGPSTPVPDPTPTTPAPPAPTTTAPAAPVPTTTAPADPAPTTTAPADPAPTTTEPADPEPTATATSDPEPTATPTEPPPGGLPHEGWTVAVDSQQTGVMDGAATNAIDGDPATFWHTRWNPTVATMPHVVVINLGDTYTLRGMTYLPRAETGDPTSANGRIGRYRVETSTDGFRWRRAARGAWADDGSLKTAAFGPRRAHYIRLYALSEAGRRGQWTSAAEFDVLGGPLVNP